MWMQSLANILAAIEQCSGIIFADHERILFFDAQTVFHISDLVSKHGSHPWNAIEIETGKFTRNVTFEPEMCEFYDSVLFFTSANRDCTIVHFPEAGVSIQFAMTRDATLASEAESSELSRYQDYLDWAKLGEKNIPWTRFVYEWKALPDRFA